MYMLYMLCVIRDIITGSAGRAAIPGAGERHGAVANGPHVAHPRHSLHGGRWGDVQPWGVPLPRGVGLLIYSHCGRYLRHYTR